MPAHSFSTEIPAHPLGTLRCQHLHSIHIVCLAFIKYIDTDTWIRCLGMPGHPLNSKIPTHPFDRKIHTKPLDTWGYLYIC